MRFERMFSTIDAHAAGEPLRIITAGVPPLPGATVLERRRFMAEHYDHLRRTLLFEPRGHADMYGAVLTPPVTPGADFGVLGTEPLRHPDMLPTRGFDVEGHLIA